MKEFLQVLDRAGADHTILFLSLHSPSPHMQDLSKLFSFTYTHIKAAVIYFIALQN